MGMLFLSEGPIRGLFPPMYGICLRRPRWRVLGRVCLVLSLGLARINAVRLPMYMVRVNAVHHRHIESGVRVTAVHQHFGMAAFIIVVLQSAPSIGGDGE